MKKAMVMIALLTAIFLCGCGDDGGETATEQTKTGVTLTGGAVITIKGNFTETEWSIICMQTEITLNNAYVGLEDAFVKLDIATALNGTTITIESSGSYTFRTVADDKQLYYVKGKSISATQLKDAADKMGTVDTVP